MSNNMLGKLTLIFSAIWSIYQFIVGGVWFVDVFVHRNLHLYFGILITLLSRPPSKKAIGKSGLIFNFGLILISSFALLNVLLNFERFQNRMPFVDDITQWDFLLGAATIIIVLEVTRRTVGIFLPVIAALFLLYALYGHNLPGILTHHDISLRNMVEYMYMTTEGIFGIPIGVSSTFIYLFILFSVFLGKTGTANLLMDSAFALTGRAKGGPAKAAVVGSCVMGMISGSAAANVVTTGSFTIPLMKKVGYRADYAGAVEAVASTGGMFMPPIMGAAAFIMAEFTGVGYWNIVIAAFIPAVLYYVAIFFMMHFQAIKLGLRGLDKEILPSLTQTLSDYYHLIIVPIALIYFLASGLSPTMAAFYSVLINIAVSFLRKKTRLNINSCIDGLIEAARAALSIVTACACAGIIVGIIILSGIGLKFTDILVTLTGGHKILLLFVLMVTCLVLGTGMPTTAAYITVAILAVPALIEVGVEILPAHLTAFYFANLANFTPPVMIAVYAAAGIAKETPMKIGLVATRLGIVALIIPYMFIYDQHLLFKGPINLVLWTFLRDFTGVFCMASAIEGYLLEKLSLPARIVLFLGSILFIMPNVMMNLIAFCAFSVIFVKEAHKTHWFKKTIKHLIP
jgi:TRAP transporter 4TM/12TM fusion protein